VPLTVVCGPQSIERHVRILAFEVGEVEEPDAGKVLLERLSNAREQQEITLCHALR
jgi:hypothetical protein